MLQIYKKAMLKSKALLLTQGMHGMISQVEGLSKALGFKFKHETIRLKKYLESNTSKIYSHIRKCFRKSIYL